ncbi:zinc carboxypeptidase [Teleopsis dalmanni]|uniref:zinc carboxypeptidase n=1 Tax=Teleopsis dalmanni TaxID=139649 RepID=UPI0018CD246F|nr:zinc carboxypeptidase [Teleopsis dalmanni]
MKGLIFLTILSFICLTTVMAEFPSTMRRLDGFKVYQVQVADGEQLTEFRKMSEDLSVEILKETSLTGTYDVAVAPSNQEDFEERCRYYGLLIKTIIKDLQNLIEQGFSSLKSTSMDWEDYHDLKTIYQWIDHIAFTYRHFVKTFIIGFSYDGRPIKALKVQHRKGTKNIVIDANIHAIEWISSATLTCFINNLLSSTDPRLVALRENYTWYFVPIVNPDGFVFSHEKERLWRKNRKPTGFSNSSGICYGTDLNRNFDYQWMVNGYNMDVPCDHWYAGSAPDSEPEVKTMVRFLQSIPDIKVYLAMHSYGNLCLLPYGHTNELPPNYDVMEYICKGFAKGVASVFNTQYLVGPSGKLNYPVSGAAKDYAFAVLDVPFSATIELRDRGTYGFFLPADQIADVCEEVTEGLISLFVAANEKGLFD